WAVMVLMMMVFVILVASTPKFATLKPDGFSSTAWEQLNGALGYLGVGTLGLIILFGFEGSSNIKTLGRGVLLGILAPFILVLVGAVLWPGFVPTAVLSAALPPAIGATSGMAFCLLIAGFAIRIMVLGNAAFPSRQPARVRGRRAVHGES